LNEAGVRYLIVGGYAVMVHTEPRFTKDLDIWIDPQTQNADRLSAALARFGAPLADVTAAVFTEPDVFYQIGIDPVRIDIMTSLPGLSFAKAWENRLAISFNDQAAFILGLDDLIRTKTASGRRRDKLDLRMLRRRR
jgi:hypothetical protein